VIIYKIFLNRAPILAIRRRDAICSKHRQR